MKERTVPICIHYWASYFVQRRKKLPRFSAYVYVADEEEGVAMLDVIRLGQHWESTASHLTALHCSSWQFCTPWICFWDLQNRRPVSTFRGELEDQGQDDLRIAWWWRLCEICEGQLQFLLWDGCLVQDGAGKVFVSEWIGPYNGLCCVQSDLKWRWFIYSKELGHRTWESIKCHGQLHEETIRSELQLCCGLPCNKRVVRRRSVIQPNRNTDFRLSCGAVLSFDSVKSLVSKVTNPPKTRCKWKLGIACAPNRDATKCESTAGK